MTNLILSLIALTAFAAPWQCVKTKDECLALRQKAIECLPLDNPAIVAIYGNDVAQCTQGVLGVYEAKETAKYKARNGGQNPRADYFDYATRTPLGNGNNQESGMVSINVIVGGIVGLLSAGLVWLFIKFKK